MRDNDVRFRAAASATHDWEYWIGAEGDWLHCSPGCEAVTGHPASAFLADPGLLLRLVVAPDRDTSAHLLGHIPPDLGVCHLQFRILSAGGDIRWLEHTCEPVHAEGRYVGRRAINRDITERKDSERLLVLQRDLARAVAAAGSLDDTLHLCLAAAITASDMDCGGVYLVRPDGSLTLTRHQGLSDAFVETTSSYPPDSRNAAVVAAGLAVYASQADMVRSHFTQSLNEHLTAVAIVPISNGEQVVGCLNIASHVHATVHPRARLALEAIAAQIGPLIARERIVAALHDSERSLRAFFDTISDFLFILDADGAMRHVNPAVLTRLGYREDELIGRPVTDIHPPGRQQEAAHIVAEMLAGRCAFCPVPLQAKDGRLIPVETIVTAGHYQGRAALFGVSRDISERESAAAELRARSEDLARFNRAAVGRELRMLELEREVNALCESAGLQPRYTGKAPIERGTDGAATDDHAQLAASHAAALHLMEDAIVARARAEREVVERARAEAEARQALANTEVLLREIHHRVKNNLQVVSGLLQLQFDSIDDPKAIEALKEGQDRILSIARVHEQLYQSPDLAALDFRAYVDGLTTHLVRTHGAGEPPARVDLKMPTVTLGLNAAIPCALILNELVTNSFKHAFAGLTRGDQRVVTVGWTDAGASWRMFVHDNGPGMPDGLDTAHTRTLGLRLVHMLARQLRGTVVITPGPGCRVTLEFPR
ncbi:MAG: PAS domain S-box protein [Acidobacteria bacterium]|nr:PAS domain S-box protein [Acidobacteriota bacterium]